MKKLLTTVLFLCIYLFSGYAQGNLINQKIQQARNSGEAFEVATAFAPVRARSALQANRIQEQVFNPQEVYVLHYDPSAVRNFGTSMTFQIPLGNRAKQLELREVKMFFDARTICGQVIPPNENVRHFQGVVKGDPNSLVAITFGEDEVIGLVATDEGNFNIAFDQQLGAHVFFNDRNAVHRHGFICETSCDGSFEGYCPDVLMGNISTLSIDPLNASLPSQDTRVVRLYFETTFDIYQARGSASAVSTFVSGLFNQVQLLFLNEGIFTVGSLAVWTERDPYYNNIRILPPINPYNISRNLESYLVFFQNQRGSFDGDLGMLLTFRNLGGGIAAGTNGLCNPNVGSRLSVAGIHNNNAPNFPDFSGSVHVIAHEFGHLLGSRHTHDCVWIVDGIPNSAIDGCATPRGCANPGLPVNGGTIMSYCHLRDVGVNFSLGFGEQPGNVIRHSVSQATCLRTMIQGPAIICNTGTFSMYNNMPASWTVSPGFGLSLPSWVSHYSVTITSDGTSQVGTITAIPIWPAIPITKTIRPCPSTLSGTAILCPGSTANFNVQNLPACAEVRWTHGPGLAIQGANNQTTVRIRSTGGGIDITFPLETEEPTGTIGGGFVPVESPDRSWVRATITSPALPNPIVLTKNNIMVGPPMVSQTSSVRNREQIPSFDAINGFEDAITYHGSTVRHNNPFGITAGEWRQTAGNNVILMGPAMPSLIFNSMIGTNRNMQIVRHVNGIATMEVRLQNTCGWSNWATIEYHRGPNPPLPPRVCPICNMSPCQCGSIIIFVCPVCGRDCRPRICGSSLPIVFSPNPVSDILTIDLTQTDTDAFGAQTDTERSRSDRASEIFDIRLLNSHGMTVRQQRTQARSIQFDVSNLPEGTYYLHIEHNGEVEMHQIIVQRN